MSVPTQQMTAERWAAATWFMLDAGVVQFARTQVAEARRELDAAERSCEEWEEHLRALSGLDRLGVGEFEAIRTKGTAERERLLGLAQHRLHEEEAKLAKQERVRDELGERARGDAS